MRLRVPGGGASGPALPSGFVSGPVGIAIWDGIAYWPRLAGATVALVVLATYWPPMAAGGVV